MMLRELLAIMLRELLAMMVLTVCDGLVEEEMPGKDRKKGGLVEKETIGEEALPPQGGRTMVERGRERTRGKFCR